MISLVLSGGRGERLWPVSRAKWPKPFSPFFDTCLFTQTVKRLESFGEVWVCTSQTLMGMTESQIRRDNLKVSQCLYEPFGRNTAPAIALAVKVLEMRGRTDEVLGIFPADHWIEKPQVFVKSLLLAGRLAEQNKVVTLGITPSYPATGFGYIELQTDTNLSPLPGLQAFSVVRFCEKPQLERAQEFLRSGRFVWNSGIFVFKAQLMIELFRKHMPDMWQAMSHLRPDLSNLQAVYSSISSESIDYGIMEKIQNLVNIPCEMGWSDLGSWEDLATLSTRHPLNSKAQVIDKGQDNFVFSTVEKSINLIGVKGLTVVETPDALLIAPRGSQTDMRSLVSEVQTRDPELLDTHRTEYRPWGHYQNLHESPGQFKTKVIQVEPGQQLSYQSHQHRAEIWVTVSGQGEVVLNEEIIVVKKGSVVHIPQGAKHRMRNTSTSEALQFVEVQLGESFAESDITRYSDDYQRV